MTSPRSSSRSPWSPSARATQPRRGAHRADGSAAPDLRSRRGRGRVHPATLAAVFAGGAAGGALREAVVATWPGGSRGFPWGTFAVNTAGSFALALLVVLVVEGLRPTRLLRPLLGIGFCGALTTFGAVVVGADRLAERAAAPIAVAYLAGSVAAGLAAGALGIGAGRLAARRRLR